MRPSAYRINPIALPFLLFLRMAGRKKMKLTKKSVDDKEITETAESRWENLDYDLLQQVLKLLPVKDLIRSICLVCRSWKLGCLTFLFWKNHGTLDLSPLKNLLGHRFQDYMEVQRALKFVLNWDWKTMECIRSVMFAPSMYLVDSHLALVAKRLPKLKKLVLPESNNISLKGFSRIIRTWKELEELSIGSLMHGYSDRFFPTLGKSCKNLTTLHIFGSLSHSSFSLDKQQASIITQNLLKLRVLSLDKTYVHKSGVRILLSKDKNLVELNLKCCRGEVDLSTFISVDPLILSPFLENEISMEIKSCEFKNCQEWYIASSLADHGIRYTTEELVNHLWPGIVEIEG